MLITKYSILASFLCFNLFVLLIVFLRKNSNFIKMFGIKFMLLLTFACVFRLLFPVEFPFVHIVNSDILLSAVRNFFDYSFNLFGYSVTIGGFLFNIICIFMLFGIFQYIIQLKGYFKLVNSVNGLKTTLHPDTVKIYNKLLSELEIKRAPTLIQNNAITTPCTTGYLKPVILIPDLPFSESALYYILKHELTHYINKDVLTKLFFCFIRCILWWNPLVYILQKEMNQMLEIKCDLTVCSEMSSKVGEKYVDSIISVLRLSAESPKQYNYYTSAMALDEAERIKQRIMLVMEQDKKHHSKLFGVMTYFAIALLVLLSYSVLFQSFYEPPAEEYYAGSVESEIKPSVPENSEIVIENGVYKLYTDGEYIADLDEQTFSAYKQVGYTVRTTGD